LKDLFAPLVLEIDVDVGRLVALAADETLEEQVDAGRVDGGDAEAIADGRVRRRPAALAENPAGAGEADQIVDGQEVVFVLEFGNEGKLALDEVSNVGGKRRRDGVTERRRDSNDRFGGANGVGALVV
jgi:hypothetical protein